MNCQNVNETCVVPCHTVSLMSGQIKATDLTGITDPGKKAKILAGNLNALDNKASFWWSRDLNDPIIVQIVRTFENLGYNVEIYYGGGSDGDHRWGGDFGYHDPCYISLSSKTVSYKIY